MLKIQQTIMDRQDLSRRERQILDILHEQREATARQVLELLPDPPSYSAVRSLLTRLVDKDLIRFYSQGRHYLYTPLQPRVEARQSALRRVVKTFFDGSPTKAANALLGMAATNLSPEEITELRRLMDEIEAREAAQ